MLPKPVVVDSSAIIAWLAGETGGAACGPYLEGLGWQRIITPLTLFEVRFTLLRKKMNEDEQRQAIALMRSICELREITEEIALRAATIRFKHVQEDATRKTKANISMADAIAIALAESLDAPLLASEKGIKQVTEVRVLP